MSGLPLPQSNIEWHGALTHFPIVLLFVAVLFDAVSLFYRRGVMREVGLWMLTLCVISLPFSLLSGWLTGREYKRAPVGYDQHWQAAVITSVLALLLLVWRLASKDKMPRAVRVTVLTLTMACAMGVGYTGHQGGEMVFGGRESEAATTVASTPTTTDAGGEKIDIAAGRMQVAAEKLGVATERLASAAGSKTAPPAPAPAPVQVNNVPLTAIDSAAQKLNDVAARFERTAAALEEITKTLQASKGATTPAPTAPTPNKGGTPTPAATPEKGGPDPALVAKGEKLFFDEDNFGCTDCHAMNGKGRPKNGDLTHEGAKQPDIEWHIAHLKEPSSKVPGSKMPAYNDKTADDLRALATYLASKK